MKTISDAALSVLDEWDPGRGRSAFEPTPYGDYQAEHLRSTAPPNDPLFGLCYRTRRRLTNEAPSEVAIRHATTAARTIAGAAKCPQPAPSG